VNSREKILAILVSVLVGGFLVSMIVDKAFLSPMAEADASAARLEGEIEDMELRAERAKAHARWIDEQQKRTFGTDEHRVSEAVRNYLDGLLKRSELRHESLSIKPVTGTSVRGAYKEIGWNIRTRGRLADVINFLYLLQAEPYLHRIENLVVTPRRGSQELDLQLKYATLLLEPRKGAAPTTQAAEINIDDMALRLDTDERQQYAMISDRNLFLPYVKRPPAPPVRPTPTPPVRPTPSKPRPPTPTPSRVDWARYRIMGLPTWQGREDVIVQDTTTKQTRIYAPGDELAEGKVVMIDYRPLPHPDKPLLLSRSRVIIQIGPEYWAVEIGQTLAQKRMLMQDQLPDGLKIKTDTRPAELPDQAMTDGEAEK